MKLEPGEYRLRNHLNSKLYVQEEMLTKLRAYETFCEGGVRLQIEAGRPTTLAEICVTVFELGKDTDKRQYYFPANSSVEECKTHICKDFGLTEPHTLYRCDAFEEPKFGLRRLKVPLT